MKLSCLLLLSALLFAAPAYAEDAEWEPQKSATGLYSVELPQDHQTQGVIFPVENNLIVNSEQKSVSIDQRPYQNIVKTFMVRADQTLGPALTAQEVDFHIGIALDLFEKTYAPRGGKVIRKQKQEMHGHKGGVIELSYEDAKLGPQLLRAEIFFSNYAKYQLMAVGNQATMDSFRTRGFFNNFIVNKLTQAPAFSGKIKMREIKSPNGLYSVFAPPLDAVFFPKEPNIITNGKSDIVQLNFRDPVRNDILSMNVLGYSFDTDLTYKQAQEILAKNHIFKDRTSIEGIEIAKGFTADKKSSLETTYEVTNEEKLKSGVQRTRLKAVFQGNKMVVAEILGSHTLVNSKFGNYLMDTVDFLPAATAAPSPAQATPAPAPKAEAPKSP